MQQMDRQLTAELELERMNRVRVEWRSGGVEEWRSGGVEEWRSGGVESN